MLSDRIAEIKSALRKDQAMTPTDPDIIEAAQRAILAMDACEHVAESNALATAISAERELRQEIMAVLNRCEFADSSHDEYSRMCQCCGASASVEPLRDEDGDPIDLHRAGPYLPPFRAKIVRSQEHAADCRLAALLKRLA